MLDYSILRQESDVRGDSRTLDDSSWFVLWLLPRSIPGNLLEFVSNFSQNDIFNSIGSGLLLFHSRVHFSRTLRESQDSTFQMNLLNTISLLILDYIDSSIKSNTRLIQLKLKSWVKLNSFCSRTHVVKPASGQECIAIGKRTRSKPPCFFVDTAEVATPLTTPAYLSPVCRVVR